MKTTTWILLGVIGAILLIIGLSIAWLVVWQPGPFGISYPTMPFTMPGFALMIIGGLLLTFSILGFIIGYSGRAAAEAISEGVKGGVQVVSEVKKASANVKYCPKCGAGMPVDAIYCPKCAHKQPET